VKRLLVTGMHGFVGRALARLVANDPGLYPFRLVELPEHLDLRKPADAAAMAGPEPPHAVIHLAAQSFVPEAFRDPRSTFEINVLGTLNLLQALRAVGFGGRMVYVGTGDVYGRIDERLLPVPEGAVPEPRNPYAVSKLAAEALCRQWSFTERMDVMLARPFNHIGWGQSDRFVVSDFARQVVAIARGRRPPVVEVGDIDVTRDFTDVDDVVRAYFALLEHGVSGATYNVCSGREQSIRATLARLAELANVGVSIAPANARMRRAEQRRMCGDPAAIHRATGWQATTAFDDSLQAMLHYWETEDRA
jgi:GDP-4-dehydro-6-deoxy-D-mannose reductase